MREEELDWSSLPGPAASVRRAPPPAAAPVQEMDWSSLPVLGAGGVPRPQRPVEPTSVRSAVTGSGRTEFPNAPEFITAAPGALQGIRLAAGYLTSAEPDQMVGIIRRALPEAEISRDRFGNPMVRWQGTNYYINQPGVSGADMFKLVGDIAAFGRLSRLVSMIPNIVGRVAGGAAAGAGISAGQDVAASLLGSEEGVSGSRAAISAGLGGATEALVPAVSALSRTISRMANTPTLMDATGNLTASGQVVFRTAGLNPADYTRDQIGEIVRMAASAGRGAQAQATAATGAARAVRQGEFGIPRTVGQRTGDQAQINLEDTLRHGGMGPGAQGTMSAFDAAQRGAVDAAGERVRTSLTGQPAARSEEEIGTALRDRLQSREGAAERRVQSAYNRAGAFGDNAAGGSPLLLEIGPRNSLRSAATTALQDTLIDPAVTPGASAILRQVEQLEQAGGITIGQLEILRRQIRGAANAGTPDGRALGNLRRALDGWADDAIQRGLFAGDEGVLEALKGARSARAAYGRLFEPDTAPQRVGQMLTTALQENRTGQELFNAIFGAGSLGSTNGTQAALAHLRTVFPGEHNPMFLALREGAIQRIFGGMRPAEQSSMLAIAQRMDDALTGRGQAVIEGLFNESERALMRRYSTELREIANLSRTQNPSGTAYKMSQIVGQLTRLAIGEGLGQALGAGPAVGAIAATVGATASQGAVGGVRAAAATRPGGPVFASQPVSALLRGSIYAGAQATVPPATSIAFPPEPEPERQRMPGLLD